MPINYFNLTSNSCCCLTRQKKHLQKQKLLYQFNWPLCYIDQSIQPRLVKINCLDSNKINFDFVLVKFSGGIVKKLCVANCIVVVRGCWSLDLKEGVWMMNCFLVCCISWGLIIYFIKGCCFGASLSLFRNY